MSRAPHRALQDADDSRVVADLRGWPFTREATNTERTLLGAAGYDLPPDSPTVVDWLTTAVRRRRWPAATVRVSPATTTAPPTTGEAVPPATTTAPPTTTP